jgi:NAD(P)-dependent dehydrogenase (short-subunit alcohol dehydrogenase family)
VGGGGGGGEGETTPPPPPPPPPPHSSTALLPEQLQVFEESLLKLIDKFSLEGNTALVTGGAGLLGKQFTRTLGEAGAKVVVADKDFAAAYAHAQELRESNIRAIAVKVDVKDPESVSALVEHTVSEYGSMDVLVNCAALDPKFDPQHIAEQSGNSFERYPLEAWQASVDVNLTGVFLTCQAAARKMEAQGSGVIINISSIYGLAGPDQRIYPQVGGQPQFKPVDYSVTKAGILGLTRYLAAYYAGTQIRVNALTPGGIYHQHDDAFTANYSAKAILGRMASEDEMNGALLFLASDASSYMTGANLIVDGGYTAW